MRLLLRAVSSRFNDDAHVVLDVHRCIYTASLSTAYMDRGASFIDMLSRQTWAAREIRKHVVHYLRANAIALAHSLPRRVTGTFEFLTTTSPSTRSALAFVRRLAKAHGRRLVLVRKRSVRHGKRVNSVYVYRLSSTETLRKSWSNTPTRARSTTSGTVA